MFLVYKIRKFFKYFFYSLAFFLTGYTAEHTTEHPTVHDSPNNTDTAPEEKHPGVPKSLPLSVNAIEYPLKTDDHLHIYRPSKAQNPAFVSRDIQETSSVFVIKDLKIELTPSPNSDIRQTALQEAQQQAFQVLFKRLTGQELSSPPEFSVLKKLIQSYQVKDESITGRFYKAFYTIAFFPQAIRSLLHTQNIAFAETYSKPILLIPIYRINGKPFPLFSSDNTWLQHWQQVSQHQETLIRLIVPPNQTTGLLYDDIAEKNTENILQFLRLFNTDIALISIASIYTTPDQPLKLEITDRLISQTGQIEALPPFTLQSTVETLDKLMQTALEKSLDRLEKSWKNHNLLTDQTVREQTIHVSYDTLNQWLELKNRLDKVSLIKNYQITELSPKKLVLIVQHYGSIDHLKQAVEAHNLSLFLDNQQLHLKTVSLHHYLQESTTAI